MKEQAIAKIKKELADFKGGSKESAVKKHVADTLTEFCRQDDEFAQAVAQNDKTLSDCCAEAMKGAGNAISDLEVYKRAAQFYFPGCEVRMSMSIDLVGAAGGGEAAASAGDSINLDLTSFL